MREHTINYELSSYLINPQGKLGLNHLLNLLQDVASTHAQLIGLGFKSMSEMNMFWVLTRQNVRMSVWPKWHDIITIKTWIRAQNGAASNRDFRIYLGDKLIGEATTSWLPLNAETRKPVAWDRNALIGDIQNPDKVSVETNKLPPRSGGEALLSLKVRNSDIDQNMHVNNTKYAQWVLDAIPFEDHFKYTLTGYEVNFLAECKLHDVIRIERTPLDNGKFHFQGVREGDEKVVFTSVLSAKNNT